VKDYLNKAQRKASKQLTKRLQKYGIACLWGQIRSGKTRAFLDASRGYRTLVVTKKDAMSGILSEAKEIGVEVDVINYHSIQTKNPDDYTLTILDECFTGDVEILTEKGWVRFDSLQKDISVAQYDINTKNIDFQKPVRYIKNKHDGEMITFKSDKLIDLTTTPNHDFISNGKKFKAKDMSSCEKLPVCGYSSYSGDNQLTPFEKLMIIHQADGSLQTTYSGIRKNDKVSGVKNKGEYTLSFSFKKDRKIDDFLKLMKHFDFNEVKATRGRRRFLVYNINSSASKIISDHFDITKLSLSKCRAIIEYMVKWDGHVISDSSYYYSSIIEDNVDFYQTVAIMCGYKTNKTLQVDDRSDTFSDVYRLFISKHKTEIGTQCIKKEYVDYKGYVYCVEMPKGTVIVRRLGKVVITGNCHLYISQSQPKTSTIWKNVKKFTDRKFIIYASGTPTAEGYGGLYHMMSLSSWSPFREFKRFTHWFQYYGVPEKIYLGTIEVNSYKKTKIKKIKKAIKHLVVTLTRKDTGHKHEVKDIYLDVPPNREQLKLTRAISKDRVITKKGMTILADTGSKYLQKLHQIAGGVAVNAEPKPIPNPDFKPVSKKHFKSFTKDEVIAYEKSKFLLIPQTYFLKKEPPKVKYIKDNFDVDNTIILSFYKHEQEYLSKIFPHTGSVTKLSTGVDLSHYKTMVVYSMSFSASNYEQVRGRLMNVNRKTPMTCNYLITGIDDYVLEAVKNKNNFTASWYYNTKD